ncbi:MAG: SGNH/GDSL hydrolase family protein [Acidobacteriota bacterium]|jgi:hypothetical protein
MPRKPEAEPGVSPQGGAGFRIAAGLLAAAVALLLFLGIAEVAFRLLGIHGEYLAPRTDVVLPGPEGIRERVPYGFVPHATIRSRYDGDPRGALQPGAIRDHVFNADGWRDVEHPVDKPSGTLRILGLGDSYLFGQGVAREDVVLAQLGTILATRRPDLKVETINTGMSGYNTAMERDLLVARGLAYDPDLLLVFFVLNDVERDPRAAPGEAPKVEFFREYTNVYQQPDALSRHSYLWGWARQRYLQAVEGRRYIREMLDAFLDDEESWAYVTGALDDIDRIAREHDLPWAVIVFPFLYQLDGDYPFQPIHDRIDAHVRSLGVPVLDLRDAFRAYRGPELWVHPTDQHPNEIAHRVAAMAIADFVSDPATGLLP